MLKLLKITILFTSFTLIANNQPYVELNTLEYKFLKENYSKKENITGVELEIVLNAKKEDQEKIWIDLNNNGIKDVGEKITKFYHIDNYDFLNSGVLSGLVYPIDLNTNKVRIYGNITEFSYTVSLQIPDGYGSTDKYNIGFNKINVSKLNRLNQLNIYDERISDLKLSKNLDLEYLRINCSNLKSINLSNNKKLKTLSIDNIHKTLQILNLSTNNLLEKLELSGLGLDTIDISNNRNLKTLVLKLNDKISKLNISKNKKLQKIKLFKLKNIISLNTSNNKELEIISISECMKLHNINIDKNLNLKELDISQDNFQKINFSKFKKLKKIELLNHKIANLDFSKNIELEELKIESEKLSQINITKNKKLKRLNVWFSTNLKKLNTSENTKLEFLSIDLFGNISKNKLNLDFSKNTKLKTFYISGYKNTCIKVNKKQLNNIPKKWDEYVKYVLNCK